MQKFAIRARGLRNNQPETLWLQNPATGQYSPKQAEAFQFNSAAAASQVMQRLNTGVASEMAPGFRVVKFEEVAVDPEARA